MSETRLGPFFFTYRPDGEDEAVTVPGYFIPIQWPPDNPWRAAPHSAFVYTEFTQPIRPLWSVPADTQPWNAPSPTSSSSSLSMSLPWPGQHSRSSLSPTPSSSTPPSPIPPSSSSSSSTQVSLTRPQSSPRAPSSVYTTAVSSLDSASFFGSEGGEEAWLQPTPRALSPHQVSFPPVPPSSRRPSSPYDDVSSESGRQAPYHVVPEIAITSASNSTHSLSTSSLRRLHHLGSSSGPNSLFVHHVAPPRPPLSTPPPAPTISPVQVPDRKLSERRREHVKPHERKSIPTEWILSPRPVSPLSPIHLMDVDEAPESPPFVPSRPSSAASSSGESAVGLRRRPVQILRPDRPDTYLPSSPGKELISPAVTKAKSMSSLQIQTNGQSGVHNLPALGSYQVSAPHSNTHRSQNPTSRSCAPWPEPSREPLHCRPLSLLSDGGGTTPSSGPVRSRQPKNLCRMVDRVPLTLLPESSDPRKRRLKSLDDIVAEGWSMTSPSNSVSTDPRSTHSMSQSGSSSEVELGITAKRRLANSNPPGYNMIPAIPSRLLAEHARQRRAEAQSAQSIEMTSSSNLNVSTLAEMLQKSLTISEPEDGHTFQSNSSELEFDLDFELDGDTMWSDEGVIGDGSFRDYRGHQCTLVCQRLLEPSGSKARCTASANSEPGDQNEMGDAHSSHILDIDRAFRRSRSFTLAPQGYVHVDDAARISDQSSSNFSTASSSDSWCVSGPRADGGGGGSDHNHHEGSINRLIGPGWSPHASPGSCSSSPRWAPDPYECGLPLATITEASEEDSPTPQTRFWSTREYLSSVASAHKDQR